MVSVVSDVGSSCLCGESMLRTKRRRSCLGALFLLVSLALYTIFVSEWQHSSELSRADEGAGSAKPFIRTPTESSLYQREAYAFESRNASAPAEHISNIRQCAALGRQFTDKLASYVRRHYHNSSPDQSRTLMYSCESDKAGHFCGGMGDRFRGMITTFYLALLSDRRFELFHPKPVPLEELLEPHIVKFTPSVPRDIVDRRGYIAAIPVHQHLMRLQRHRKFLQLLDDADSRHVKVLRVQSNSPGVDKYVHQHRRWRAAKASLGLHESCNISCYFGCLYAVLFRPSEAVAQRIDTYVRQPLISVQVRVGGSWASGMRVAEPFRTPPATVRHFAALIEELRTTRLPPHLFWQGNVSWLPGAKIFVSSDAPRFIAEMRERFGDAVLSIDGGFNHTDTLNLGDVKPEKFATFADAAVRSEYLQTLLNHLILQRGAHFVMAQSGFGDTAFWASRTSASCIFVDMNNNRFAWQHHQMYDPHSGNAVSARHRILDIHDKPSPFYQP